MYKICEYCKTEFWTDDPEQVYCKGQHSKAAWRKRRKTKRPIPRCNTPYKKLFTSIQEATDFLGNNKQQEVYLCKCTYFHLRSIK